MSCQCSIMTGIRSAYRIALRHQGGAPPGLLCVTFRPNRMLHSYPSIGPVLLHELTSCT
jgi:hypothetical protein